MAAPVRNFMAGANVIKRALISVSDKTDLVRFAQWLHQAGVKTLHPKVYGGILGRRGLDEGVMQAHSIQPIDLVVVNLYPFEATVAKPGCDLAQAIEHIDIGGSAMPRATAKKHQSIAGGGDPAGFVALFDEIENKN